MLSRTVEPSLFALVLTTSAKSSPFNQFHTKSVKCFDDKDSVMDPLVLAKNWNIGVETA